jgi:diguanylate cyclase (GGDEF)-like protein
VLRKCGVPEQISLIAVTFQTAGTALLAIVLAQLARTFNSTPARWWAAAWAAFSVALVALRLSVTFNSPLLRSAYILLQWTFLYLLWVGSADAERRKRIVRARLISWTPLAVALSAALTLPAASVNEVFIVESIIVSLGALLSYGEISRHVRTPATRMMRLSLLIFSLLYASYAPIFFIHSRIVPLPLLAFSSFVDLLACVFIGCAMIMVTTEAAHDRLESALTDLMRAHGELERRFQTDFLTEAFSRHAFHWMQQGAEIATADELVGVVVMFDIDNLKEINDTLGHPAGDTAIRAVANAIRSVIRGDDLLFRWGGDEFVAVIPNLSTSVVAERLKTFENAIAVRLDDGSFTECRVSYGCADFGAQQLIDEAIRQADARMYAVRSGSDKI